MQTKFTSFLLVIIFATVCFGVVVPVVSAQDGGTSPFGGSGDGGTKPIGGGGITNPLEGSADSVTGVLKRVINWMLGLVGFLALIALIIGGARMIMDFGNEDQVKKAKSTILWAVIGLAVVILSYAIINIVSTEILGSGSASNYDSDPGSGSSGYNYNSDDFKPL